jgi:hypothetical protein
MKSLLVYQLGYDEASDQEYLVDHGLFVVYERDAGNGNLADYIKATADQHWGMDWFGLAYQSWDNNDFNVEKTYIFKKAAE